MHELASEFRRTERRHMIRVKEALQAALATPGGHAALALACVEHLGFIIGRFLVQGRLNVRHLEPRITAAGDGEGRQVIDGIAHTLAGCEAALAELQAAAARLKNSGTDASADFEASAERFLAFYDSTLASRKDPAQQIIRQYFTDGEYWALTDDISDEVIDKERDLFARIVELAPAAVAAQLEAPWPEPPVQQAPTAPVRGRADQGLSRPGQKQLRGI